MDQLSKVPTHCPDDRHFAKDDFETVGELADVWLARTVTEWKRTCDKKDGETQKIS